MWLLKTNGKDFPEDATGNILGVNFTLGFGIVDTQFYYQHLLEHGFIDVTPKWMKDIKVDLFKPDSRVLMVRWGAYGDNLLCEPAIRALKEKYPNVKICFAGRPRERRILNGNPIISDWYDGLKHRIVQYVGQYDDAYDFTHSIECNPESEYKDAKEIACEWVGRKPESGMIPKLFFTKEELRKAKEILKKNNIDINKDKIIGIHIEASAPQRTLHPSFTIKLANKLAKNNYKVILLGAHYQFINTLHYIKCNKCKKEHEVILAKNNFKVKCNKCGNEIKYAVNPNIVNLVGRIDDVRVAAAIVKYLNLLIAPDSMFIHVAQATKTKTFAIYTSFDASTRCKYYENIYVYQRPFRCAVCHQHGSDCVRWMETDTIGKYPPCVKLNVKEVYPLIKKFLKGKLPSYIPESTTPKFETKCPICFSHKKELICRKGKTFYFICTDCGTIFRDRNVNIDYNDLNYYKKMYGSKESKEARKLLANELLKRYRPKTDGAGPPRMFEIGCKYGEILKAFKNKGWSTFGIERSKKQLKKVDRRKLRNGVCDFAEHKFAKNKKNYYDLVVAIDSIQKFNNIEKVFIKMRDICYAKGKIFIVIPSAEYSAGNKDINLNTYFAGENTLLFSPKGLGILCNRLGLEVENVQKVKGNIFAWIVKK